MKMLFIGGAGNICSEAVRDFVKTSNFNRITIGDINMDAAKKLMDELDDDRVDIRKVDVFNKEEAVSIIREYDVVAGGTDGSISGQVVGCIAEAGVPGLNLSGMMIDDSLGHNQMLKDKGLPVIVGCGMTPGVTNVLARYAYDNLDKVDEVYVSHGSFRPMAYSPGIARCQEWEYDPKTERLVFEDGEFLQVLPFARPKTITLPEPYGTLPQYIIPHPETTTLAESFADKGVRLVEVRGTWPEKNMLLVRALYEWGLLRNPEVEIKGAKVGVWDAIAEYLLQSEEGTTTKLYGYALHVEVTGKIGNRRARYLMTTTHPSSDGSVPEWAGLRAYTKSVGLPLSIGAQLLAAGKVKGAGIMPAELALEPMVVFEELKKRGIIVHEDVSLEGSFD